jgi:hypothetical protein
MFHFVESRYLCFEWTKLLDTPFRQPKTLHHLQEDLDIELQSANRVSNNSLCQLQPISSKRLMNIGTHDKS